MLSNFFCCVVSVSERLSVAHRGRSFCQCCEWSPVSLMLFSACQCSQLRCQCWSLPECKMALKWPLFEIELLKFIIACKF